MEKPKTSHMVKCDRCDEYTKVHTMSHMNLDQICIPCEMEERKHPKYKIAADREIQEVRDGNYSYPGLFYGQKWPFEDSSKQGGR